MKPGPDSSLSSDSKTEVNTKMDPRHPEQVTIEVEDVGPVRFKRSRIARHLNIRVKPFTGVEVSMPRGMNLSDATAIVRSKAGWIKNTLVKVKESEKRSVIYDGKNPVRTRERSLVVSAAKTREFTFRLLSDRILFNYPAQLELSSREVQTAIRTAVAETCRIEAKAYLPTRVAELARAHGFRYKSVFIKNHKSRWGSCSAINNINLSLHLMRLPDEIIDYVILHELVHTEIKDHSKKFWARVRQVCPDVLALKKRLRFLEKNLPR